MSEAKAGAAKKAAPAPQKKADSPKADSATSTAKSGAQSDSPKPGDELDPSAVATQAAVVAQSVEQGKADEAAAKAAKKDQDKEEEVAVVQGNVYAHPEAVDSEAYTAPKEDKK